MPYLLYIICETWPDKQKSAERVFIMYGVWEGESKQSWRLQVCMIKNNGINAQCGSFCIENLKLFWREARQIVVQLVLETWERRKSAKYNIFSLLSSLQPAMTNIRKKLKSVRTYMHAAVDFWCIVLYNTGQIYCMWNHDGKRHSGIEFSTPVYTWFSQDTWIAV